MRVTSLKFMMPELKPRFWKIGLNKILSTGENVRWGKGEFLIFKKGGKGRYLTKNIYKSRFSLL